MQVIREPDIGIVSLFPPHIVLKEHEAANTDCPCKPLLTRVSLSPLILVFTWSSRVLTDLNPWEQEAVRAERGGQASFSLPDCEEAQHTLKIA